MGLLDAPPVTPAVPLPGLLAMAFPPNDLNRLTDGVVTGGNYRTNHKVIQGCRDIRIAYSNWYTVNGPEVVGLNDITVRAGIEFPLATTPFPVYFNGQRDVVIKPGATVWSDPIALDPAFGTTVYVRTFVSVTAGGRWPVTLIATGTVTNGETDLTTSAAAWAGTTQYAYWPCSIRAIPTKPRVPVVAIVGDSVSSGYGDSTVPNKGYWIRAFNDQYAYQQVSFPSATVEHWTSRTTAVGWLASVAIRRKALLDGCTHAIAGLGRNSLGSGSVSITEMQANQIALWTYLRLRCPRGVWQTTITPHVTSTDAYATTGNQTIENATKETNRVNFNAWVRDGAPMLNGVGVATGSAAAGTIRAGQSGHPLVGYVEVTDVVETARDSGKWKSVGSGAPAAYTADGIHPSATANTALATAMTALLSGMFGPVASA